MGAKSSTANGEPPNARERTFSTSSGSEMGGNPGFNILRGLGATERGRSFSSSDGRELSGTGEPTFDLSESLETDSSSTEEHLDSPLGAHQPRFYTAHSHIFSWNESFGNSTLATRMKPKGRKTKNNRKTGSGKEEEERGGQSQEERNDLQRTASGDDEEEEDGEGMEDQSERNDIEKKMEKFFARPFDEEESWDDYESQFLLLCKVKGLGKSTAKQAEARRDLLLAYVGTKPLKRVNNFLLPRKVTETRWDQLLEAFRKIYKPKKTLFAARLDFEQAVRNPDESFADFVTRLKEVAVLGKYGEQFEERVRDRFAGGIRYSKFEIEIRQRWPEGVNSDKTPLKVDQLLELAQSMSTAQQEIQSKEGEQTVNIGRVNPGKLVESRGHDHPSSYSKQNLKCSRCGLAHGTGKVCPANKAKCYKCTKGGHFARMCRGRRVNQVSQWEEGEEEGSNGEGEEPRKYSINMVRGSPRKNPQAKIEVQLNGVHTTMEFDSGARASIISSTLWNQIGSPKLSKPRSTFLAYGNNVLDILGECKVQVKVQKMVRNLNIAVVSGNDAPLFGLPWILAFDMKLPKNVHIRKVDEVKREQKGKDKEEVQKLIEEFWEVFDGKLGKIRGMQAKIHVKENATPKRSPARRVPFPMKKRIEKELDRLVQEGILEEVNPAEIPIEWATPTVNIEKPNGDIRICGDFAVTLNPQIILETALLPTFEELTAKLADGEQFTIIDLKDAYLQLEVAEEYRKYLVIATHKGYYRYFRLPFGISSCPGIYQRIMEEILKGLEGVGVLLDDIIITAKNREEHRAKVREVLKRLQNAGLKAKLEKCKFFQNSVKYLGHKIDRNGIHPTEEKIEAIRGAPAPENKKQLRSFLGLVNYHEKFIPRLHGMCAPLHKITGNNARWTWTQTEQDAFQKIKGILSSEDAVVPYNENRPLVLECDASEDGLGCVLKHRYGKGIERPIAYASRTLTETEKRYAIIDREALAIMFGVKKFHQFVYGREFTIVTDNKPLQRILGDSRDLPKVVNNRLVRWALELNTYQFTVEYRKGKENECADMLSRLPIGKGEEGSTEIKFLNMDKVETVLTVEKLKAESKRDKEIQMVTKFVLDRNWPSESSKEELKAYRQRFDELVVEGGVLCWFGRVVIPAKMRAEVLKTLHCGHPGIATMRALARYYVWWPHIDQDVEVYVKRGTACQESRDNVEEVPVYPWNVPDQVWERVHLDLAGPVDGVTWLVGIDALSKWAEVECLRGTTSATIIQRLRGWFSKYGLPKELVTDNGPQFVSAEIEDFFKRNGIRHIKTTPYHPRSNGLVERLIRTLKTRYSATKKDIKDPTLTLQNVLFSYRNAPQKTTGRAPAELFLGRRLATILDNMKPDLRKEMELKLWKQQTKDEGKKARVFEEGEEVWVKKELGKGWTAGVVMKRNGPYSYEVKTEGKNKRKHADQLRGREGAIDDEGEEKCGILQWLLGRMLQQY